MIGELRQKFDYIYADLLIDVMDDASHPLHDPLVGQLISRSDRMRSPSAVTGQYLSFFCSTTGNHDQNPQCQFSEGHSFH